jgi:hypothetical protein
MRGNKITDIVECWTVGIDAASVTQVFKRGL